MANNDKEEGKKVLKLDLSRNERAFDEGESLWDMEIAKIERRLKNHVRALAVSKEENEEDIEKLPLLSIAVFGSPGSGKSSLLRTLAWHIRKGKIKSLKGDVYSLPVIKPNLLVKGAHFLYTFLATALKADRDNHEEKGKLRGDSPILSRLQQRFQEVSGYLQVINEDVRPQENDPLGMSLELLERHESGLILIDKMRDFIDELANIFKGCDRSSVVLMPVDDADISQEVLVKVLDTCWWFLRHPRLVPVFTFTGRLAEELLRVEFDEKLTADVQDTQERLRLKETSTFLSISENMAIQYLGRLFPVRNRIRLRPISARVLAAEYESAQNRKRQKVKSLLQTASRILFGHTRVPAAPSIKSPFSKVTLRRQIQIVDAMQAMGIQPMDIDELIEKMVETDKEKESLDTGNFMTWGQVFDMATWSLLNAHRDVLKEMRIDLDDLYSWTPMGLRQVVLDSILGLKQERRLKLIKHWRYRTEDRRSQIISLLAVNVFRPRMEGEEPTGDEPDAIEYWLKQKERRKKEMDSLEPDERKTYIKEMERKKFSFPISQGVIWFLDLFIGFYLPQVLACNRYDGKYQKKSQEEKGTGSITGIGWDLSSGPIHAVREALKNKKIFSTGMLFLDPREFARVMRTNNSPKLKVFIWLWCFFGFGEGRAWAAVSLWRGLGLLGKIIQIDMKLLKKKVTPGKRKSHIETLLMDHFDSALVLGNLPKGPSMEKTENGTEEISFEDFKKFESNEKIKKVIGNLADKLINWHDKFRFNPPGQKDEGNPWQTDKQTPYLISPMNPLGISKLEIFGPSSGSIKLIDTDKESLRDLHEKHAWEACFTRRLHGENLMYKFWQDLENAYYQKPLSKWKFEEILKSWCAVLQDYWKDCGNKISINTNKAKEFTWGGERPKIKEVIDYCPLFYKNFEKGKNRESLSTILKRLKVETIDEYSFFREEDKKSKTKDDKEPDRGAKK